MSVQLNLDHIAEAASLLDGRGLMFGQLMCTLTDGQANDLGGHIDDMMAEVRRLRSLLDDAGVSR